MTDGLKNSTGGIKHLTFRYATTMKNEDPARFSQMCLMVDVVAIRRQVQYDRHTQTMTGFVDLGDSTDETKMASEAIVFTVVGL